jgi:protein-tyrosine phosphatase
VLETNRYLGGIQRVLGMRTCRRFAMPPRILFVCTANVCRSPMAEGVLRKMLAKSRFPAAIDSAATTDHCVDMPPHPMALAVSKRRGYNITHILSRQVRASDFVTFDLIVAVDGANRDWLRRLAPANPWAEIRLLLEFGTRYRGKNVPDPYGFGPAVFERSLDLIEDGCSGLARHLRARRVLPSA